MRSISLGWPQSALVTIDARGLVLAGEDSRPVVSRCAGIQVPLVNNQPHHAGGFALAHPTAVDPLLVAGIAVDMAPTCFVRCVDGSGVQVTVKNGKRVAYVVAAGVGATAVLPFTKLSVVDPKVHMPIIARRLIAARARLQIERHTASQCRVVPTEDIAQGVIHDLVGMHPGSDGEVAAPQP